MADVHAESPIPQAVTPVFGANRWGRNAGYGWAFFGVVVATECLWLVRNVLDKGQASLLYLPIVIACAVRFGFGPAVLGAFLSFLCWDFFFLPPFHTFVVYDPKDWISLFVFLVAAVSTAQLASRAREQSQRVKVHEEEIATLFEASESLSREMRDDALLTVLAQQLQTLCRASCCVVFRSDTQGALHFAAVHGLNGSLAVDETISSMAFACFEHGQVVGFGSHPALWKKDSDQSQPHGSRIVPAGSGVYVPLYAEKTSVGVLHVGPRLDGLPFSGMDERLILTLANHAAVGIARAELARQAAQAEALREADALKDSLLSLVSHELRSPLAAIKALVTGMLDPRAKLADSSRWDNLRAVDRETDRLSAVVNNLLDLSRLEAGAWRPHKDWCDLAEVVATSLDHLPDDQAARVGVSIADDLPLIRADYTQLALVLTNLMENAVKYTPLGSPIRISTATICHSEAHLPDGVKVEVRDFGPGIEPGEEEQLFERFYRGHAHCGSVVHGVGLGLALCRIIVGSHGGRIWVTNAPSDEPCGAVFTLFLPIGDIPQNGSAIKNHE